MLSTKSLAAWALAATLLALLSTSAFAGTSSLALNQLGQGLRMGDQVTYTAYTTRTDRPWAKTECFQSGKLVYKQYHGLFPGYFTDPVFTLGPTALWTSGGASCTGTLLYFDKNGNERSLATTSFLVQ